MPAADPVPALRLYFDGSFDAGDGWNRVPSCDSFPARRAVPDCAGDCADG